STILTTKPLPTIKEAFSLMTIEKVNQIGSYKLTDKITIHDALVVPGDQVGTGSQREGLYFLDVDKKFVNRNITTCLVSKCMWHNRLGHPANQVLKFISEQGGLNSLNYFDNQWPSEPFDDERDKNDSGCTNSSFADHAVEYASADRTFTTDLYASTSYKGVDSSDVSNPELDSTNKLDSINTEGSRDDNGATLFNDDNISKGEEIKKCKDLLSSKFFIKDIGNLKYLLGIEVIKNDQGICLSQRKYSLELLSEFRMLACKPSNIPLYVSKNKNKQAKLIDVDEFFWTILPGYQKLVGKLIYLTITRSDISYDVHKLSQVMHAPELVEMKSTFKVLRYINNSSGTGIQYPKSDKF
nr:ribonuclease H-like domain-containing protein [Tanacetum cinerariifolium]